MKRLIQVVSVILAAVASVLAMEFVISHLYHRWGHQKYIDTFDANSATPWK